VVPAVPEAAPKHVLIPAPPINADAASAAKSDESEQAVQIFAPLPLPAVLKKYPVLHTTFVGNVNAD